MHKGRENGERGREEGEEETGSRLVREPGGTLKGGKSITELAEENGLSRGTVYHILRGALEGVPVNEFYGKPARWGKKREMSSKHELWQEMREKLVEEYNAGATLEELASRYGCSRQNIQRKLERAGVDCRAVQKLRTFLKWVKSVKVGEKKNKQNTTYRRNLAAKEVGLRWCSACREFRKIGEEMSSRRRICNRCNSARSNAYKKTPVGREKHKESQKTERARERAREYYRLKYSLLTPEEKSKLRAYQRENARKSREKKRLERERGESAA